MLSIIVPVYNGEDNLRPLFTRLSAAVAGLATDAELLFINDGSTDGSLTVMKELCGQNDFAAAAGLKTGWMSLKRNSGQQMAVLCGLRNSRGDYAVTIDDDLEHPPELIPELLGALEAGVAEGLGAVYAVPQIQRGNRPSLFRRAGAALRDLFFALFLGKPRGLRIGSYRIFSRAAIDAISQAGQPFVYISAELFRSGFKACAIEYIASSQEESNKASGRYSPASRILLYLRLLRWYGPLNLRRTGFEDGRTAQYEIAGKGGCL